MNKMSLTQFKRSIGAVVRSVDKNGPLHVIGRSGIDLRVHAYTDEHWQCRALGWSQVKKLTITEWRNLLYWKPGKSIVIFVGGVMMLRVERWTDDDEQTNE